LLLVLDICKFVNVKLVEGLVDDLKVLLIKEELVVLIEVTNLNIFIFDLKFVILKHSPLICCEHLQELISYIVDGIITLLLSIPFLPEI